MHILGNLWFYAANFVFGAFPWALLYPLAVTGVLARERDAAAARPWRLLAGWLFFSSLALLRRQQQRRRQTDAQAQEQADDEPHR